MPPRKRKDPFEDTRASAPSNGKAVAFHQIHTLPTATTSATTTATASTAVAGNSDDMFDTSRLRALLEQQAAAQDALIQQVTTAAPPIVATTAVTATVGATAGHTAGATAARPAAAAALPVRHASVDMTAAHGSGNALEQSALDSTGGAPELDPADIVFDEKKDFIGCGVFGKVYKGMCRGQVVAVKVPLNQDELTDAQLAEFRAEVAILRKIYHPNVVLFLGASTQPHRIMIVTQFMARGSLDALLKSDTPLSFDERLSIAKDVALGLSWLHNISKIVHRDLKPANLLLNYNLRCKITDFGFAQLRQLEHKRETQPRGSVFWMSPELLMGQPFNESVDLFSYGIILWQILTRRALYDNQYSDVGPFMQAVCARGERPHVRDDDCSPQLAALMRHCWAAEPRERCTADHVCAELDVAYVEKCVTVAPGNALQQAPDTNYDDASGAGGGAAAAAALETATARAFWRLVCSSNPLPSSCALDKFSEQLKLRLPRGVADDLVSRFVQLYCKSSDGARASTLLSASSAVSEPLDPRMSVERFSLLLCCLGPWLPREVLLDTAFVPPGGAARAPSYPRDVAVALDVIAWALRLADCAWFHAFVDKDVAERRLANRRERTFLVRMSSTHTDFPFTISLVRNAGTEQVPDLKIQHKRIQRVWDRQHPSNCQWLVANTAGTIVAFTDFFEMIASDELRLRVACDKDEISMPYM